jgi:predicted transposase/invertase (TIGR01784 family)
MQTDALFYHLFKTIPGLFFEIAKLDYPPNAYQFSSIEVKQISFRLDGVFKPPETEPDLPIIFVEVQFQADKQFYARFFSEIFLYLKQYQPQHDWKSVIIFPKRAVDNGDTRHYPVLLDSPHVSRIYLEDFKTATDNFYLQLIQMIIGIPNDSITVAKKLISQAQDNEQILLLDLVETIMLYKFSDLSREEIKQMLDLSTVDMKQTRFYQEACLEGESLLLNKLLEKRFGLLPESILVRLKQANKEKLENWAMALLSAKTLDDVFIKTED